MNKLAVILVGLLGLAVVGYAFMGPGLMDIGGLQAWGGHMQGKSPRVNMTVDDQAALMQANWEGNYANALAVMQKYGFNGTLNQDLFNARAKVDQAILNKDWTGAVQARDDLRTLMQQQRQAQIAAWKASINATSSGNGGMMGRYGRMGMRAGAYARGYARGYGAPVGSVNPVPAPSPA